MVRSPSLSLAEILKATRTRETKHAKDDVAQVPRPVDTEYSNDAQDVRRLEEWFVPLLLPDVHADGNGDAVDERQCVCM